MTFNEFDLHADLLRGIEKAAFFSCMPVQEKTLAETLNARDVYVQSQTGSGKTAAFLITIFEQFLRSPDSEHRALVIVPTRELAVQIEKEAKLLGTYLPYRTGSFYGGVGYTEQLKTLDEKYEIIVGTPGRLIDLHRRKNLNFRDTSIFVIDEADRLFDMGFLPDLRRIIRSMPPREQRMTMLYSATLNSRVWQLAWEHMNDPTQIIVNPENLTVDEVHQELYHVARAEKLKLLLGILKKENAANILIFTNTKSGAVEVANRLAHNGYESKYIIGDLPQNKRLKVIERMKAGELKILVATDVAARGLHIDDLPLVVNYDLPEDPEGYVHRIGRTARAGNTGKAISLACERYVYSLESIEELLTKKIPVARYDPEMLLDDESEGKHIERHRSELPRRHDRSFGERSRPNRSRNDRSRGDRSRGDRPHSIRSGNDRPRTPAPRMERQQRPADSPQRAALNRAGDPPKKSPVPVAAQASSKQPIDKRLEYYKKKYGEDFKQVESPKTGATPSKRPKDVSRLESADTTPADAPGKSGFFSRLLGKKRRSN